MPTWEAATYLTDNLFGDKPNPRLLRTGSPHEDTAHLLHCLYKPLVEAATRDMALPSAAMIHVFTDISLTGNSAVLVVYIPDKNQPHQLLLLDAAKAWESVFETRMHSMSGRKNVYSRIKSSLANVLSGATIPDIPVALEAVKN